MAESISEILDPRCVELDLVSRKKPDIVRELAELLAKGHDVADVDRLVEELLERERLSSTGVGNRIAIPHKLTRLVRGTALAFGRKSRGAKFEAVDRKPVVLFFLLVGPEGTHTEHLQLLSRLSRFLHDPGFVGALNEATSAAEVVDIVRAREEVG